ncbi:hypothetical protein [Bernardetia sp. MNP-M8]|uniref:hypothetical protein n=1 Tax=Bernardetia sp. MNP-M8 TaxID=3127470 RepID=UPI0030D2B2B0
MKTIVLLFLLLVVSACSRGTYYAYEDEHSYCTIELKSERNFLKYIPPYIIYRATSDLHYDTTVLENTYVSDTDRYKKKKNVSFLFIENENSHRDSLALIGSFFMMYYIPQNITHRFRFCTSINKDGSMTTTKYVLYKIQGDSLIAFTSSDFELEDLNKEHCFERKGIDWFPPYLIKTNKIEYEKFKIKDVKKKFLRNPQLRNAPFYDSEWEKKRKKQEKKAKKKAESKKKKN